MAATVKSIGEFLGKSLSPEDIEVICNHCNVKNMRQNQAANFSQMVASNAVKPSQDTEERTGFIRKGVVGDWKNYFTADSGVEQQLEQLERQVWGPVALSFSYDTQTWNF